MFDYCVFGNRTKRSGNFLTLGNINNVLKEIVVYGILASALTFPLINGTFDLSIESTCALGGTCCALLITDGLFGLKTNLFFAVILSVLICSIVGVANGLLVSRTKIDPFIVTLGTQTAVRGIVYIVCNNSAVTSLPDSFKYLSSGKILGISVSIWILILVFVMMALVLGKTSYGRKIYAIGGSYTAAYISGINVKKSVSLPISLVQLCPVLQESFPLPVWVLPHRMRPVAMPQLPYLHARLEEWH